MQRILMFALLLSASARGGEPGKPGKAVQETRLGLAAEEKRHWDRAIYHFKQAQEAAPWDALTRYRLARTHDLADNELPAIAWYRSYLAAAPDAGNAGQVRERIDVLKGKARKEAEALQSVASKTLMAVDRQEWFDTKKWPRGRESINQFLTVSARLGQMEAAEQVLEGLPASRRDHLKRSLVLGCCHAWDFAGAERIARSMSADENRCAAYAMVAMGLLMRGDTAAAEELAERIEFDDRKFRREFDWIVQPHLAAEYARRGNLWRARNHVSQIPPWVDDGLSETRFIELRLHGLNILGYNLALAGDFETATKIARRFDDLSSDVRRRWSLFGGPGSRRNALLVTIFRRAALDGDFTRARETAISILSKTSIKEPTLNKELCEVAMVHARCGDLGKARQTLAMVPARMELPAEPRNGEPVKPRSEEPAEPGAKIEEAPAPRIEDEESDVVIAIRKYAYALAETGDIERAKKTADTLGTRHPDARANIYRHIGYMQADSGDFSAAIETAESVPDGRDLLINHAAETQASRGDVAGALKTLDLISEDTEISDQAYEEIALAQAAAGDFAAAIRTAEKISYEPDRLTALAIFDAAGQDGLDFAAVARVADVAIYLDGALADLADLSAARGNFSSAKFAASCIDRWARPCFARVAARQFEQGDASGARETLGHALQQYCGHRSGDYLSIAEELAEVGDVIGLERTAEQMRRMVPYRSEREAFLQLAHLQHTCGDEPGARDTRSAAGALTEIAPTDRSTCAREQRSWARIAVRDIGLRNYRDPFDLVRGIPVSKGRARNLARRTGSFEGKNPKEILHKLCDETEYILDGLDTLQYWKAYWDRQNRSS